MAAGYMRLSSEIARITTSPYPASLLRLHELITTQCTDRDVFQWSVANPCQIEPLAAELLNDDHERCWVLDIIARIALLRICRDSLLQRDPTLLHVIVTHAAESDDGHGRYTTASAALLSHPLPDDIALPAPADGLLSRLVDELSRSPSPTTIKPIYRLLRGVGHVLLRSLPGCLLNRFQDKLLETLQKSTRSTGDQGMALTCLCIMSLVCFVRDPPFRFTASSFSSSSIVASGPVNSPWSSDNMQQFFTGNKAARSIQLCVLTVILSLKTSPVTPIDDRIAILRMANELISAIPVDIKAMWCTTNVVLIRKLHEKLADPDAEHWAKTLSLRFVGKLCNVEHLSQGLVQDIWDAYLEPRDVRDLVVEEPDLADQLLLLAVLPRCPPRKLLDNALRITLAADVTDLAMLTSAAAALHLVASLMGHHDHVVLQIAQDFVDPSFRKQLAKLYTFVTERRLASANIDAQILCPHDLLRKRHEIAQTLSQLILKAVLMAKHQVASPLTSLSDGIDHLLAMQAQGLENIPVCSLARTPPGKPALVHPTTDTADHDGTSSCDWRLDLANMLHARTNADTDAIIKLFSHACSGLEARCENVERPLRDEQKRNVSLQTRIDTLEVELNHVQQENLGLAMQSRVLDDEKCQAIDHVELCQAEVNVLLGKVAECERQIAEHADRSAQREAQMADANQLLQVAIAAQSAKWQEEREDLQEKHGAAQRLYTDTALSLKDVQVELESVKTSCREAVAEHQALQTRLDVAQTALIERNQENANLREKCDALSIKNTDLERRILEKGMQIQDCAANIEQQIKETGSLQVEFNTFKEASEIAAHEAAEALRYCLEDLHSAQFELADLQETFRARRRQHAGDVEQHDAEVIDLRRELEMLRRECDRKDLLITNAETMRKNLIAAIGLPADGFDHSFGLSIGEPSFVQASQNLSPPTSSFHPDMTAAISSADASFASLKQSRSGVERIYTQSPINTVISSAQSIQSISKRATRTGVAARAIQKRRPLQTISGNRGLINQHSTDSKIAEQEMSGRTTFDGDDIFTNTQSPISHAC